MPLIYIENLGILQKVICQTFIRKYIAMFKKLLQDAGMITSDQPANKLPPIVPIVVAPSLSQSAAPTELDPRAVSIVQGKVDESTLPGYTDFVLLESDLRTDINDPAVRTRTALKTVLRMKGVSAKDILLAVDDRLKRLEAGRKHLVENVQALLSTQLSTADKKLTDIATQRKQLEEQLISLSSEESKIRAARATDETDLTKKISHLDAAASAIRAELNTTRALIAANLNS